MRKLIAIAALLFLPSLASAQGLGEIFEGLTSPQLIGGVSYDQDAVGSKYQAVLTANILGPKLGTIPCYISGVGVGLNTVAPGLEDAPIASWSFPLLSCAPWGERVTIQAGFATALSGGPKVPYIGIGVGVAESPNSLRAKRVARIEAKKKKALLELQDEAQRMATR